MMSDQSIAQASEMIAQASESIARAALVRVVESDVVGTMRADSPLPGFRPADAVALSVAITKEAAKQGWSVTLGDHEFDGIHCLGDLTAVIGVQVAGVFHD
ncbi:MAG: hypothetical protein WCG77_06210 [Actinomycetes bacterium]